MERIKAKAGEKSLCHQAHVTCTIKSSCKATSLIWSLMKAVIRHGNKKVVTTSYQRIETLGPNIEFDREDDIFIVPGT